MRVASFFTGIAGFELGNHSRWEPTVMVENDPNCQVLLADKFPGVSLKGDIADVEPSHLGEGPETFVGGFPCTDVSKGHPVRLGLAGPESGNYWHFHRLLFEYQRLIDALNPRWVVIENPRGLLTSPGKPKKNDPDRRDKTGWDMAAVARSLEDLGYGWAYRVVDAKYFGSPQHRDRVLVVGHRGGDPRPAGAVLGLIRAGDGPLGEDQGPSRQERSEADTGVARIGGNLVTVFRKSARAQATLAEGGWESWIAAEHANTLTGNDSGRSNRQTHYITQGGRLRTLTLLEWERLQAFPDGWTDGYGFSDSTRFRMLGNAMHVGMADWLGSRLVAVDAALPQITPIKESAA